MVVVALWLVVKAVVLALRQVFVHWRTSLAVVALLGRGVAGPHRELVPVARTPTVWGQ
ncbi:MAG: hypothetical protein ACRDRD_17495 [Pseudonocardiaceae bacterium]